MAVTRLTDIIEPDVFDPYVRLRTTELTAIFEAGIANIDPRINALLASGGTLFEMPAWEDLATAEPNVSDDNPASTATPANIGTVKDQAVKHMLNYGWGSADLLLNVVGEDPMREIADKVAGWWARAYQNKLISSIQGVIADNEANDSGDMVNVIGNDSASAITAAELVSASALLDAMQTMGDASGGLQAMTMHSVVATELKQQNLITFIPNSRGEVTFATYLDKLVIVDDGSPATARTNRTLYSTYLFGGGAFGFGETSAKVPVEVEREAAQGNGAGVETLWTRRVIGLHPRGIQFTEGSVAGNSPTNAELAAAANWDRVYDRKLIRLAELRTNG